MAVTSVERAVEALGDDAAWQGNLFDVERGAALRWAEARMIMALEQALAEVRGRLRTLGYVLPAGDVWVARDEILKAWLELG